MKKWIVGLILVVVVIVGSVQFVRIQNENEGIKNTAELIAKLEKHEIPKMYYVTNLAIYKEMYEDLNKLYFVDLPENVVIEISELNSISEKLHDADIEGINLFYAKDNIDKNTIISSRDKEYFLTFIDKQLKNTYDMDKNELNKLNQLFNEGQTTKVERLLSAKQRYKELTAKNKIANENAKKAAEEKIKDKLIVSNIDYNGDKVSFSVKNNKSSTVTYIEFDIRIYDSSNNVIDTDWTNWSGNLRVGDSAKVETYVSDGKSISINVSDWSY